MASGKNSSESSKRESSLVIETALRLVVLRTKLSELLMSLPRTVADVIHQHVTLELESLDRVYLNAYQPQLQTPKAVFRFLRQFQAKAPFLRAK